MLTRNRHTWMDDQKKKHPRMNRPKQLQTHNAPTDDIENTNGINRRGPLTERMLQVDLRYRRITTHWSTYPQGQQNKTKKSSYSGNSLQKENDTALQNRIIDCLRNEQLSRDENPESNLLGRCAITVIISKSDNAIETHIYIFISRKKKINHLMYTYDIKQFAQMRKN